MISVIFWNIRGLRSQKAIDRLKNLININHSDFVAISEHKGQQEQDRGLQEVFGFHGMCYY